MIAFDADDFKAPSNNNFSWLHTPVGAPRGVVVFVVQWSSITDDVTAVTYGGVAMARLPGADGFRTLGTGETGAVYAYFLGSGIPVGPQTVAVTSGGQFKCAVSNTVTAAADTEVDSSNSAAPGIIANPSLSVPTTASRNTEIFYALMSGIGIAITTVESGSTHQGSADIGSQIALFARKSHTGGSTTIGYTAASDDVCHAAVAIGEVAGGTVHFPPQGLATAAGISPTASVAPAPGVALALGVAPTPSALSEAAGVGIAVASGIEPSAPTFDVAPQGLAVALGIAPSQRAGAPPGVATALGVTPTSTARAFPPAGRATAIGIGPTITATAPPGSAAALGIEPGAAAAVEPGAFAAAGQPVGTTVGAPTGSAIATGVVPSSTTVLAAGVGTAIAAGVVPAVSVPAGVASATGDHVGPTARTQLTMTVVAALGVSPAPSVPVDVAVAVATGIEPGDRVRVIFPTHSSGHKPGGGGGSLGGVNEGHIQQPIRGSAR